MRIETICRLPRHWSWNINFIASEAIPLYRKSTLLLYAASNRLLGVYLWYIVRYTAHIFHPIWPSYRVEWTRWVGDSEGHSDGSNDLDGPFLNVLGTFSPQKGLCHKNRKYTTKDSLDLFEILWLDEPPWYLTFIHRKLLDQGPQ